MGSQKRSCLEEESSEEDEEDEEDILDQREVEWKTDRGMYTVTLKLEKNYENDDIQEVRGVSFVCPLHVRHTSARLTQRQMENH